MEFHSRLKCNLLVVLFYCYCFVCYLQDVLFLSSKCDLIHEVIKTTKYFKFIFFGNMFRWNACYSSSVRFLVQKVSAASLRARHNPEAGLLNL